MRAILNNYLPYGWHQVDSENRPILYIHIGESQIKSLMTWVQNVEALMQQLIKELESMWAHKFAACNVDKFILVIDMKGSKLKDMQNSKAKNILKSTVELFDTYYGELLHRIFVLNAPMFFDDLYTNEDQELDDIQKLRVSNSGVHDELVKMVPSENLPEIYGGTTNFDLAQGLFNEIGPWSDSSELALIGEEENKGEDFYDDEDDIDEGIHSFGTDLKNAIQGIPCLASGPMMKSKGANPNVQELKAEFNIDAFGELANDTPNATPMNTWVDDEC